MTTDSPVHRATTSDIARVAGVSRATVSHVLNNHRGKFSPETEERVLAALSELEYRPSMGGRALANGTSDILVVVLASGSIGVRVQDALDQVVAQAAELGASVLTRFAGPDVRSTVDALLYIRPLAVMDLGGLGQHERRELDRAGVTLIPDASRLDEEQAVHPDVLVGELQVAALSASKRRIAVASLADSRTDSPFVRTRGDAVEAACLARGLEAPRRFAVPLEIEGAIAVLREIAADGPVGVACYNDDVASALVAAAKRLGLAVPHDVAVVGVDVTPLGQLLDPPLASVMVDVAAAMDYNMDELRRRLGRPVRAGSRLGEVVSLHPGGTA